MADKVSAGKPLDLSPMRQQVVLGYEDMPFTAYEHVTLLLAEVERLLAAVQPRPEPQNDTDSSCGEEG